MPFCCETEDCTDLSPGGGCETCGGIINNDVDCIMGLFSGSETVGNDCFSLTDDHDSVGRTCVHEGCGESWLPKLGTKIRSANEANRIFIKDILNQEGYTNKIGLVVSTLIISLAGISIHSVF